MYFLGELDIIKKKHFLLAKTSKSTSIVSSEERENVTASN